MEEIYFVRHGFFVLVLLCSLVVNSNFSFQITITAMLFMMLMIVVVLVVGGDE
jgi:hypothetical protein